MKKIIVTALVLAAFGVYAQLGKNLETKLSGGGQDPLNELPKGYEMYSTVHTDNAGISGVYFTKYPIQFMYRTPMNTYKTFTVDQITLEFVEDKFAGRIHVVNDAVTKLVRQAGTDLATTWDFYGGGAGESQKQVAKMFDFYSFNIKSVNFMFGSIMGVSKKGGPADGSAFYRDKSDKDIIYLGKIIGDKLVFDDQYSFGGNFNVLSKDKSKLASYDSTKIANAIIEHNNLKRIVGVKLLPFQKVGRKALTEDTFRLTFLKIGTVHHTASLMETDLWDHWFRFHLKQLMSLSINTVYELKMTVRKI